MESTAGALSGLRVIDASTGIAGPLATMLLADFGAEVVKVEPPGGDRSRAMPGYAMWNRGKRLVTATDHLVAEADVLVTNQPIDVEPLANPHLVQLVVPAYLPGAAWPFTVESEGMLAASIGVSLRQGSVGGGPIDSVSPILPTIHGAWAAAALVGALIERERSGLGQTVTVGGIHGAMVASCAALNVDASADPPVRTGNAGGSLPFYRTYQCADGEWLFLAALTPRFTGIAFDALGVADLYDDPRLEGRGRAAVILPTNSQWATERIADAFRTATRDHWLGVLHDAGCPAGPVLARDDWLDHPQLAAVGMRVEVDDPERGPVVMPGVPVHLATTPGVVRSPAPSSTSAEMPDWLDDRWSFAPESPTSTPGGPLSAVRVLDLGAIIAGPYTGSLLAELGATVTKVEPIAGDSFRGPGFAAYNKGQRGIAIDLQHPRGRDALLALVRDADVVIDNYRPGVLGRLQLHHEDLRLVNPAVISVSITGFGSGGPLGDEPGFDPVLQAMSGMMAAQGGDAEPVFFTVPVNDVTAAATTALGTLVALLHRTRTGEGQQVTASLAAMSALVQANEIIRFADRPQARVGGRDHRGPSVLDRYYEASDGWIRILEASTPAAAPKLASLGIERIDEDSLAAWVVANSRATAVERLTQAGIAAVAARAARELLDDPDLLANDVLRPGTAPGREHRWTTGAFAQFSRTPTAPTTDAPALGQHTVEILTEAGYTATQIADLDHAHIVAVAPPR